MEVNHFFSSPVFILLDKTFDEHIEQLLEEVYAWRETEVAQGNLLVRSNQGGWHSDVKIFDRKEPGISRLCKLVLNSVNKCTKSIAPAFTLEDKAMQGEGWVNINGIHDYNVPHDHPGYTWSVVYYAKVPEKKQNSRSGSIEFLDPRTSVAAFAPDLAKSTEYFSPKKTLSPKDGMLLVFPSYLRHWVYPNETDGDRITFAFNVKYIPKPNTNKQSQAKDESERNKD